MKKILALAGDPGGGSALGPVLCELAARRDLVLSAYAYRQSRTVWRRSGLAFRELDDDEARDGLETLLSDERPDLVLTATSVNGVDAERHLVSAARRRGIPTIAVLDFWSNYRARFESDDGGMEGLPDRVAVMDEVAREEMMAAGLPRERLVVTGQPAFEHLCQWAREEGGASGQTFRAAHGIGTGKFLVTFVSQPIAELFGDDLEAERSPGYSQHTAIELLIAALDALEPGRPMSLLLRPHPREEISSYERYHNAANRKVLVSDQGEPLAAAAGSDLVVGMTTVLLLEAACLGRPVISLQPHRRGPETLPMSRLGLGTTLTNPDGLTEVLRKVLEAPAGGAVVELFPGAVGNVIREIDALLSGNSSPSLQNREPFQRPARG